METKPVIYTEEFVKNELSKLEEQAENPEVLVIGELFENKSYSQQRFCEWAIDFKNCQEISESIKRIKQKFENRINTGALKGKLNATMAIFNLKNNYDWRDKNETDITSGGDKIQPIYGSISRHNSDTKDIQPDKKD
jgi:hypothetical protein